MNDSFYKMENSKAKCYFVTGTGRCGSKLFSMLFSLKKESVCLHEKIFRHASMVEYYIKGNYQLYMDDLNEFDRVLNNYAKNNIGIGVSSGHLYFAIPILYKMYGDSARFILLTRKPEDFAVSALSRGFFDNSHPTPCMQLFPNKTDEIYDKWDFMTPFEKNLWYWNLVNSYTINEMIKLPSNITKVIRIEDINNKMLLDLCSFVDIRNVSESDVSALTARRINSTPDDNSDPADNNPYSIKNRFPPVSEWTREQLAALDYYTGATRKLLGY